MGRVVRAALRERVRGSVETRWEGRPEDRTKVSRMLTLVVETPPDLGGLVSRDRNDGGWWLLEPPEEEEEEEEEESRA